VSGGDGNDALRGDGSASAVAAVPVGGNDRLLGREGDDLLVGDGEMTGFDLTLQGRRGVLGAATLRVGGVPTGLGSGSTFASGADTFVLGTRDELDEVMELRRDDGDRLGLTGTGLTRSALDSNGNGQLDDGGEFVVIEGGGTTMTSRSILRARLRRVSRRC
jgi:Ca2+-binding RTX toxin-like protein